MAHLGTDDIKTHPTDAPYLIICFRQPFGYRIDPGTGKQMKARHYYGDESTRIAVGFLLSALHLSGLTTLTHTPGPMRFPGNVLNRPNNERAYVVIPVGYPASDAVVPIIRNKPLSKFLVRYGD